MDGTAVFELRDGKIADAETWGDTAQIVQAHDVIRMTMRVEHGVDLGEAVLQRLLAQIRARVDEDARAARDVDEDRGTQPLVFRIGRPADQARAADHRNAVRGAGAEKDDPRPRHPSTLLRVSRSIRDAQGMMMRDCGSGAPPALRTSTNRSRSS